MIRSRSTHRGAAAPVSRYRPTSGPGIPGTAFDVAFVLTFSPVLGFAFGLWLCEPTSVLAACVVVVFAMAHAAWLATFPA